MYGVVYKKCQTLDCVSPALIWGMERMHPGREKGRAALSSSVFGGKSRCVHA